MQNTTGIKPIRINTDVDSKYLKPTEALYILNQRRNLDGLGKNHSLFANELVADVDKPSGENYCIGSFYSEPTNENYSFHWNSLGNHFIERISATSVDIIANSNCLAFDIDPKHALTEFRAYMIYDKNTDTARGIHGKYLVWTLGKGVINYLDVELSLLTDTFNLPVFTDCIKNFCDFFNLEYRQPQKCIISEVDNGSIDLNKSNTAADKPWQWRYKNIGYDGRSSEWSPISSMNWIDHPACIKDTASFPRCFLLEIPSGDATVEKIEIAFRNDNNPQWYKYDTVHKYGEYTSPTQKWWEREIVLPQYNPDSCTFTYQFCADKECTPIPPEDTNRISNDIPNTAQCLVPIDNRLGFLNIERGNDPLPLSEKKKISFSTEVDEDNCQFETVKIKVALIVHCDYHEANQFIYQMEDGDPNDEDPTNIIRYGGLMPVLNGGFEDAWRYGQYFDGKSQNFKVYVEGTELFWTELKQYRVASQSDFNNLTEVRRVVNMNKDSVARNIRSGIRDGNYYMQVGTLVVPKGTQGFIRVMGQHAQGMEPETSTSVVGYLNDRSQYRGIGGGFGMTYKKEIFFSACTEEDEIDLTNTPFLVLDLANDLQKTFLGGSGLGGLIEAANNGTFAIDGYLKDANGAPIEYAKLHPYSFGFLTGGRGQVLASTDYSDHNGYYFFSFGVKAKIDISIETSGSGFSVVQTILEGSLDRRKIVHLDYTLGGDSYKDDFTDIIMLAVKDCNGSPLAGITVAVEGSKSADTDLDGIARVALRNNADRNRIVRAIVMQSNVCLFKDCEGNCNPCMDMFIVNTTGSYEGNPIQDLGVVEYAVFGNTARLLKHGGRYEVGITMIGNGRCSFIQTNDWFVDIPKVQQLQSYAPVTIRVNFSSPVNWPDWVEYVSFSRSGNLLLGDYLQWVVDSIDYVDRDGNPANQLSASNLRLTIQSLNDYNEKYFFKTNTKYQYGAGDRVEFISNGDGEFFQQVINTLILSPFATEKQPDETRPADFFNQLLISNDDSLANLVSGGVIEIQKPKICETKTRFQEICSPIPVGSIPSTFTLFTFDTYLLPRQIPGDTINFIFEHHSITDFWGDHVDDQGRLNVSNEHERQQRLGRDMILTDDWSLFGSGIDVNRFRADTQVKKFTGIEQGDIIGAYIWDAKVLMCIGQHDNFTCFVGDDFLRVGDGGYVKVTPTELSISNPQNKIGGRYGCGYDEVGSIYFGSGFVSWIDSINAVWVFGSESSPYDISHEKISSIIEPKVKYILNYNIGKQGVEKIRFTTGYDPENKWVMLTTKAPRQSGVNNAHDWSGVNKTICLSPKQQDFPTVSAFTPEAYGKMGQYSDKANSFLTFFRSDVYVHYLRTTGFNTFFGVATDRVVVVAANENPSKEKKFLAFEVQSDKMWFVEKVTVDDRNFLSEIPPVRVKHKMNKWNADFLRDINSRGGLYKGKACEGYQAVVTFVRDNTVNLAYKSINRDKMAEDDETDFFFIKYVFMESSGLSQK